jgi:hypothetical protein
MTSQTFGIIKQMLADACPSFLRILNAAVGSHHTYPYIIWLIWLHSISNYKADACLFSMNRCSWWGMHTSRRWRTSRSSPGDSPGYRPKTQVRSHIWKYGYSSMSIYSILYTIYTTSLRYLSVYIAVCVYIYIIYIVIYLSYPLDTILVVCTEPEGGQELRCVNVHELAHHFFGDSIVVRYKALEFQTFERTFRRFKCTWAVSTCTSWPITSSETPSWYAAKFQAI